MHNPKTNFIKFFDITKQVFSSQIDAFFNFQPYRRKPKLSDCEVIALVLQAAILSWRHPKETIKKTKNISNLYLENQEKELKHSSLNYAINLC